MASSLLFCLKLLSLCFVGVTVAFEETESTVKRSRREALDINQNVRAAKSGKDKESADGTKINDNRRNQRPKKKKFHNRRRCFLGSPYDCPVGFEDSLLDWPRPWGWGPGPLYPEYGPDLHRGGWGGLGGPIGCNQIGCGGPLRVPGSSCGCGNHGWCCCGQGGGVGGGASDCAQFSDAPPSQASSNKAGAPPLLHPFFGKQANSKSQGEIQQGKNINVQRGRKRQDITYSAAPDVAQAPPVYDDPYQATYGNWQVPQQTSPVDQVSQQTSMADQVVGGLFFWNMNGKNVPAKNQKRKH